MKRALLAVIAAAALCGCVFHVRGPEVVLKPEGERVSFKTAGGATVTGELLGIRAGSLVLLLDGRLAQVPLAPPFELEVAGYADIGVGKREKLSLYARYPQGLSEGRWAELLRNAGQEAFEDVEAASKAVKDRGLDP